MNLVNYEMNKILNNIESSRNLKDGYEFNRKIS